MKVLVTGSAGQLGWTVSDEFKNLGILVKGVDKDDFDITDREAVERNISCFAPDVVIHCAGYTAVDMAEKNVELCRKINAEGTANIAKACRILGIKLLYVSTDYVFGDDDTKFHEIDDRTNPLNVYGQSKLDGETEVQKIMDKYFIVRISWLFGEHGNNFVRTMLRLGKDNQSIRVVNDQFGSPTYTRDLAKLFADIIVTDKYGVYHATNEGVCSWAEFAEEIMRQANLSCSIIPVSSVEYKTLARRPLNSRLSKKCLLNNGFGLLPSWKDGLRKFLELVL